MKKTFKGIALGLGLAGAGLVAGTQVHADEIATPQQNNSVETIKAEMDKQKGNKQQLAVYRVQKGDTLSGIAEASGLTIDKILSMNDIPNPNLIHIGQLINLGYGTQAKQFVASKGQSSVENGKHYTKPTSDKAKTEMDSTKEIKGTTADYKAGNANDITLGHSTNVSGNYSDSHGYTQGAQQLGTGSQNNGSQSETQTGNVNNGGNQGGTTTQTPSNNNGNSGSQVTPSTPNQGGNSNVTPEQPSKPDNGGNQGGTQTPTTPDKPSQGGNTGNTTPNQPSKPDNGGNQGGTQTPTTPDKPSQGGNQEQAKLDANKINQSVQDTLTNDYGWKGQWMDSKDGYDQAVNDWQNNWEASTTDGYYVDGYATSSVGKVDKNSNTTMGSQMAGSINNNKDNHYQDYKYGYTHTTTDGNSAKTDYYFWN